jgi:hypothetical protein
LLPAEAVQLFLQYQQDQRSQPLQHGTIDAIKPGCQRAASQTVTSQWRPDIEISLDMVYMNRHGERPANNLWIKAPGSSASGLSE